MNSLADGFVVILNASKLGHHALILSKATTVTIVTLGLELSSTGFDWATLRARLPRDLGARSEQDDEIALRAMQLDSGRVDFFTGVLSQLWTSMARPILCKLGGKVVQIRPRAFSEPLMHPGC
jgi:hypothetical protein